MDSENTKSLVITTCPINKFGKLFVTASSIGNKGPEHFLTIYQFDPRIEEDPKSKLILLTIRNSRFC